jgi:hypothetical protein
MPSSRYHFDEPRGIDDARDRIALLIDETQDIEAQMSDPEKKDPKTGDVMETEVYLGWKYKANRALSIKRAEQRFLKRWVKVALEIERQKVLEALDGDPCLNLLNGLYVTVKRWIRSGATTVTESDQELLDLIQHKLDHIENVVE